MKNKPWKLCIIYLVLLPFLGGCSLLQGERDEDGLPPLTQEGRNTFGCLIDGRPFLTKGPFIGPPSKGANFQYVPNATWPNPVWVFQVFGDNNDTDERISINLSFLHSEDLKTGTFQLSVRESNGTGGGGIYLLGRGTYDTTEEHGGTVTITHYDRENRHISGTFEFEVEAEGEIVKITKGRFDMDL